MIINMNHKVLISLIYFHYVYINIHVNFPRFFMNHTVGKFSITSIFLHVFISRSTNEV